MNVIKHTDPWVHYTVPNFLSSEQVNKLFRLCEDFKWTDNMWFLNGEIQNQMPVRINMPGDLHDAVQEKLDYILEYLKMETPGFFWGFSTTKSYPKVEPKLTPHSDNFKELRKFGAGKIKMLVYLGDNSIPYPDWGTKLYATDLEESFVKEIEYVPGTAFIFVPTAETYHGTDFVNELKANRFMLGAEYMEDRDSPHILPEWRKGPNG